MKGTGLEDGFRRLAVIGVGLIGGSFALAARQRGLVDSVVACARSPETLSVALDRGIADHVTHDPAEAVAAADLVYVAAPVRATEALFSAMAPALRPEALVTDAGSTKAAVVALADRYLADRCVFVGGHPMAGSDLAGPAAARADLFQHKTYILTPKADTPVAAVARMRNIVTAIDGVAVLAEPEQHDRLVAATSHLPHLVAAALCGALGDLAARTGDIQPFTGTGLRDATRIAKGPPEVWRDILLDNRDNLKTALRLFSDEVLHYIEAMEAQDAEGLEGLLDKARRFRRSLDP